MEQLPTAFRVSLTVEEMDAARRFYTSLYPHDTISDGVFGGIPYQALMREGEVVICLFQKIEGNPLADVVPTLKVACVEAAVEQIEEIGGTIVIQEQSCPCTGAAFAICSDPQGTQFMVKEARQSM